MKTFLLEIIPRIKKYSEKLDNTAMLINKHWVVLDELENSKTVYFFRASGELLISTNGKVEKAKYEYLDHDSILIDLKEESYLFREGFFDQNVLALKVDSREEYALLISENKYSGELNTLKSAQKYLQNTYLNISDSSPKKLGQPLINILSDLKYKKDGYSFKMGSYKEFFVILKNGDYLKVYQKKSDDKYFIYVDNEILLFHNKESCLKYLDKNY